MPSVNGLWAECVTSVSITCSSWSVGSCLKRQGRPPELDSPYISSSKHQITEEECYHFVRRITNVASTADYLQDDQRDRQTRADSSSSECVTVFLMYIVDARTGDPSSQHSGTSPSPTRGSIKRRASVRGSHLFFTKFTRGRIGKRCVSTNLFTPAWW